MLSTILCACGTFVYLWGNVLCPFLSQVVFLWLGCAFSVYSDIHPLSDTWFVNIFFHSVGCLFTLLLVSFDAQKSLIFIKPSFSVFSFVNCAVGVIAKPRVMKLLPSKNVFF